MGSCASCSGAGATLVARAIAQFLKQHGNTYALPIWTSDYSFIARLWQYTHLLIQAKATIHSKMCLPWHLWIFSFMLFSSFLASYCNGACMYVDLQQQRRSNPLSHLNLDNQTIDIKFVELSKLPELRPTYPPAPNSVFAAIESAAQKRHWYMSQAVAKRKLFKGSIRTNWSMGCSACHRHEPHVR